ncbi:MAG: 4Fe-4S dicluster domain-containing protein [Candidatus Poribacteria bacterium]|nr:4Fe-4S dicluster domain-containing protein [Candidatus Poribacteria bacterium]
MALVYNWQLGRPMEFPHRAEKYPKRQFAFVFNINRCLGCQTCTIACKSTWTFSKGQEYMWWNNVETKPYGGYPQFWDVKTLRLLEDANPGRQVWDATVTQSDANRNPRPYGTFKGKTVFETAGKGQNPDTQQRVLGYLPTDEEWTAPNIFEDTPKGVRGKPNQPMPDSASKPEHQTWFFYLQRICNHCSYPACLAACPRNAIYKRPEDGIVLIDQERCRGYRKCVEACPYKKAMYRSTTRVSEKCVGCYPRVEGSDPLSEGEPMETRCMAACIGKIRMQGLVNVDQTTGNWAEDRQNPLYYLVKVAKVALPLYPQFGTQPNGYYIPPRWVPRSYLRQMFGPGVDAALEAYVRPSRELLAVLQLFRVTQKIIFRYEIVEGEKVYETTVDGKPWAIYNDTVIGYGQRGQEIVRTTIEEPMFERPKKHANSI